MVKNRSRNGCEITFTNLAAKSKPSSQPSSNDSKPWCRSRSPGTAILAGAAEHDVDNAAPAAPRHRHQRKIPHWRCHSPYSFAAPTVTLAEPSTDFVDGLRRRCWYDSMGHTRDQQHLN